MAIKARYAQQAINSYTRQDNPHTYAAVQAREEDKNVRSAVKWIKATLLALAVIGIVSTTSGCVDWNGGGSDTGSIGCTIVPNTPACK